jgi:hypothetical protein
MAVITMKRSSNSARRRYMNLMLAMFTLLLGRYAGISLAQTSQQQLPKAEQILDQYVDAIGGLAALEKINNRVVKGTMEIKGAGVALHLTIYQARPNRSHSVIESDVTGKIENGTDGEVAWQMSATAGPQVMEGKEKAGFLHANVFDRLVYWRKVFKQIETTGIEDVAGKPCYRVVVTPPDLAPQTMYFDMESHMMIKVQMTLENQAGMIPTEVSVGNYRSVDGILVACKMVTRVMGQERITTINSVEQNVTLPVDIFALPADIKGLIKKNS